MIYKKEREKLASVRFRLGSYVRRAHRCFLARFRLARAKSNVRQFQETRAAGIAHLTMVPGTVAVLAFKRKSRRNPQVFGEVFLWSRFDWLFPARHPLLILAHPELDFCW